MLKLCNVRKTFGSFTALKDLTLTVPKGSVFGLVGPNGAGKSTAIRILTGVYRPDSGTVTVDGCKIYENPEIKARIGYIPDEVFFFPTATLEEMRRFYKGIYKNYNDELFNRLCTVFSLSPNTQLRRLSKGMQKQAAFLLTLCTHADVLILDEPVDGLDPVMRRQIWSLVLSDVAQRGTTVLISSHNLRELEDVCDHVGIMNHGTMLLQQSLVQLQSNLVKLQIAGELPEHLEILHEAAGSKLKTVVVRGTAEEVTQAVEAVNPRFYQVLPLSLEEIFIYELGGVNNEVKNILL